MCIGHTNDYNEMVMHLSERHPRTRIVCVGFSLGGNIVTKYMGEKERNRPKNIIGGVSICQGYCAIEYVYIFYLKNPKNLNYSN